MPREYVNIYHLIYFCISFRTSIYYKARTATRLIDWYECFCASTMAFWPNFVFLSNLQYTAAIRDLFYLIKISYDDCVLNPSPVSHVGLFQITHNPQGQNLKRTTLIQQSCEGEGWSLSVSPGNRQSSTKLPWVKRKTTQPARLNAEASLWAKRAADFLQAC